MLEKASRDFERQQHALEEETEQRGMESKPQLFYVTTAFVI